VASYRFLTLAEVAKNLRVSQKTVSRWIASKQLRAARFGHKTYRVLESDLNKFVIKHMQK
jgi:excisionase family DNA binding protein